MPTLGRHDIPAPPDSATLPLHPVTAKAQTATTPVALRRPPCFLRVKIACLPTVLYRGPGRPSTHEVPCADGRVTPGHDGGDGGDGVDGADAEDRADGADGDDGEHRTPWTGEEPNAPPVGTIARTAGPATAAAPSGSAPRAAHG